MLTVKLFEEIFDNFEIQGFSYNKENQSMTLPHGGWNIDDSSIWKNPSWVHLFYPLLLTRIFEGMQLKADSRLIIKYTGIKTNKWFYRYSLENGNYNESANFDTPDEARESAVIYILDKIEG